MIALLQKHTLITAALVASMSLTACGKKTEVFTPPTEEQKTEQTAQTVATETEQDTSGSIGGSLPDPDEEFLPPSLDDDRTPAVKPKPKKSDSNIPPAPPVVKAPAPKAPAAPKAPGAVKAPKGGYEQPPQFEQVPQDDIAVTDIVPVTRDGSNVLPNDYNPKSNNVTRDGVTKRLTGGVTEDGLVYTSSSTDDVLDFLRARNEKVGYSYRQMNLAAAASVVSAKMTLDYFAGQKSTFNSDSSGIITLNIREGNDVKVYNFEASLSEGSATVVRPVKAGSTEVTTGRREVSGTVKCLDLDGGCENVFFRLKIGSEGSSAIINIVFRTSDAGLFFELPGKDQRSDNAEYLKLRDFMVSSIQNRNTNDKVKSKQFSSWEVVNGRSGFTVTIKGFNNELLAFAGPLLAPQAGTRVSIPLSRIGKDENDSLNFISLNSVKLNYANTIGDARLINNNGLGQVRMGFTTRRTVGNNQDQFGITVLRKVKPIVDLTDSNLK